MGLDNKLSEKAVAFRKATGKAMDEIDDKLAAHIEEGSMPFWVIDKFKELKINGLNIKGYGSPGLSTVEMGSVLFEIGKRDGSVGTFFLVHNAIGMAVIDALGD